LTQKSYELKRGSGPQFEQAKNFQHGGGWGIKEERDSGFCCQKKLGTSLREKGSSVRGASTGAFHETDGHAFTRQIRGQKRNGMYEVLRGRGNSHFVELYLRGNAPRARKTLATKGEAREEPEANRGKAKRNGPRQ